MRLSLSPFLIALGGIATSLADEDMPAPVDAPTLPGCRGMKLKQKDALQWPFPPPLVGEEFEASLGDQMDSALPYHVADQAGASAATCNANGFAGGYACSNVDLLSMLTVAELNAALGGNAELNDIWGWTHPTSKREFSIVGLTTGTAFVEITDPYNPKYLGALRTKTANSNWRDMKVIDHYALIVSEASGHGMQVFDLERLLTASGSTTWTEDTHYGGFGNAHNIFVNEESGFAYAVGTNTCNRGLHMIDVNDPMNPTNAGCFSQDGYVHDVQCVIYSGPDSSYAGKEICFCSNEDTVTVVDVTSKSSPQELSRTSYAGEGYTHQGWLTEDQAYFIFNDELDELYGMASKTRTHVMDVTNLRSVSYTGYHDGRTAAIDHNLYVLGDYVYQANYRAGLNILKINDVGSASFDEAGYFDIFPSSDSSNFNGAWSNYPYHESGVVTVSGIEQGLFVLQFKRGQTAAPVPITSTPTKAPTLAPVSSTSTPTASPTKSPTTTTTLAPVGSPTSSCSCCEELTGQADEMEKAVETIYAMMLNGYTNPPAASSTNAPTAAPIPCADSTDQWVIDGKTRRWCTFAKNKPSATARRCDVFNLYADCPVACGSCP